MPSLVVKVFLPNDSLSRLVFESIPKWNEVQKKAATQGVDLDDYKINWKDSDDDLIPVNSQSDFAEALANAGGDVLRLFAKEKGQERKKDNDASQVALAAMLKHLKDEKDPTLYKGMFSTNHTWVRMTGSEKNGSIGSGMRCRIDAATCVKIWTIQFPVHLLPAQSLGFYWRSWDNNLHCDLVMSDCAECCNALVNAARELGLLVVNDDVYNLFWYGDQQPGRLFDYDNRSDPDYVGSVISNGSFSKYLAPGLRMGWLEGPQWAIDKLEIHGLLWSGSAMSYATSVIVAHLMATGELDNHVAWARDDLKKRAKLTYDILRSGLPSEFSVRKPQGGYFIWVEMPEHMIAEDVVKTCCETQGVKFAAGDWFSFYDENHRYRNCFRVSFSLLEVDIMKQSLEALVPVVAKMV